jgi:hypothetical protein
MVRARLPEVNRQLISRKATLPEETVAIPGAVVRHDTKVLRVQRMLLQAHLHGLLRHIIVLRRVTADAAVGATIAVAAGHVENGKAESH